MLSLLCDKELRVQKQWSNLTEITKLVNEVVGPRSWSLQIQTFIVWTPHSSPQIKGILTEKKELGSGCSLVSRENTLVQAMANW